MENSVWSLCGYNCHISSRLVAIARFGVYPKSYTQGVGRYFNIKAVWIYGMLSDSFPVPAYLFLKVIKDWGGMRQGLQGRLERAIFVQPSLDTMRSSQNRLGSDWERVWDASSGDVQTKMVGFVW